MPNRKHRTLTDVVRQLNPVAFLIRQIRLARGCCPYCTTKLVVGIGGRARADMSPMKACPNLHYAKEYPENGKPLVYHDHGSPMETEGDLA